MTSIRNKWRAYQREQVLTELALQPADLPSSLATDAEVASALAALGSTYSTDDERDAAIATVNAALALKAPLTSPALAGNPTAPTQSASDNSTKLSTTAFVKTAVESSVAPWQPLTFYRTGQLVTNGRLIYRRLTDGTSGATFTGTNWTPLGPHVLAESVADVSALNTVTEMALLQVTLPTDLQPGDMVRITAAGDYTNNTGSTQSTTVRFKLGTTTLMSAVAGLSTNAAVRQWTLDAILHVAAVGSQVISGRIDFAQGGAGTMGLSSSPFFGRGTAAEDVTAAKVLAVSAQHATASASLEMRIRQAEVVLLPKAS